MSDEDELDTTEAEVLAMIAEGEPVRLIGGIRIPPDVVEHVTIWDCSL